MIGKIKEIFNSLQGEGPYLGEKHLFVRFAYCNLHCIYCDTSKTDINAKNLTEEELFDKINSSDAETVSFTGGEPLLAVDFLKSFFEKYKKHLNKKIYLETNGTLYKELAQVIDFIDIVAMDIKIKSATGEDNQFSNNEKFLQTASGKAFIKVVFTGDISDFEIKTTAELAKKYGAQLILQPESPVDKEIPFMEIYEKAYSIYKNTRLIPQTHKFLGIE